MAQPLTRSGAEGINGYVISAGSVQLHFQHDAGVFEQRIRSAQGYLPLFAPQGTAC